MILATKRYFYDILSSIYFYHIHLAQVKTGINRLLLIWKSDL